MLALSATEPNATVHPPGPLQRRGVARNENAAPVVVQRLVRFSARSTGACVPGTCRANLAIAFGVDARYVSGAMRSRPARWFDWAGERFSAHSFGDDRLPRFEAAVDPVGTAVPLPTPPPDAFPFLPIMEASMNDRNRKIPTPAAPSPTAHAADYLQSIGRMAKRDRRDAEECAQLASLPIQHTHAAGIDVGDASHWVCVEQTPDGSDAVREFPAHTPGLRQLVAWLHAAAASPPSPSKPAASTAMSSSSPCSKPASTSSPPLPAFTRQIKGRPKTDKRDCQWIQRLHKHGLLPSDLPTRRRHPHAARLRSPTRQSRASIRLPHPTHAKGVGIDEPQADQSPRRRHRRDRPEDYSRPPGWRTRSARVGIVARSTLQAHARGNRRGVGRPLWSQTCCWSCVAA